MHRWLQALCVALCFVCCCGPLQGCIIDKRVCGQDSECLPQQRCQLGTCINTDATRLCVEGTELCVRNAECAKCTNGNTSCQGGACVAPTRTCPATCTSDTDCDLAACASKNKCIKSKCVAALPCPTTCSTNTDCAPCGDNHKCVSGKCTEVPQSCPATCTKDTDCAACIKGLRSCLQLPGAPGICSGSTSQCPSACVSDADCLPCSSDRQTCINNTCANKSFKCSQNSDCAVFKLTCATEKGFEGVCSQACTSGQPGGCIGAYTAAIKSVTEPGSLRFSCSQGETQDYCMIQCNNDPNTCVPFGLKCCPRGNGAFFCQGACSSP